MNGIEVELRWHCIEKSENPLGSHSVGCVTEGCRGEHPEANMCMIKIFRGGGVMDGEGVAVKDA